MSDFEITVATRVKGGSAECRRLRNAGLVPSVIYGHNQESMAVSIDNLDFFKKASRARSSQIFYFKSEDTKINGRPALVKDIQRDFVKGKILHVDFQILNDKEEVSVSVPLDITGVPLGVKNDGGVLAIAAHSLTISALPKNIPQNLSLDVTELGLGEAIEAQDVTLPTGVRLVGNPHEVIASVVISKLTVTATTTAAPAADAAAAATPAAGKDAAKPAAKPAAKK